MLLKAKMSVEYYNILDSLSHILESELNILNMIIESEICWTNLIIDLEFIILTYYQMLSNYFPTP
jgi:hypothetical protein